jgi:hypothetical protein
MDEKYKIMFKNYEELLAIFSFSIIISAIISVVFASNYINIYLNSKLYFPLLSLFGILLGLLITAYSILFGLVPSLDREVVMSNLFTRINKIFLITLLATFSVFITSFLIIFASLGWLILLQVFFLLLALSLLFFVSLILYSLFKLSRDSAKKRYQSII